MVDAVGHDDGVVRRDDEVGRTLEEENPPPVDGTGDKEGYGKGNEREWFVCILYQKLISSEVLIATKRTGSHKAMSFADRAH